jgi:hypothetical protein
MCANGHVRVGRKKHRVDYKLSEIFEALRLSWVLKLVSIISSRRGGTKHVNYAGASGKETYQRNECLTFVTMRDAL